MAAIDPNIMIEEWLATKSTITDEVGDRIYIDPPGHIKDLASQRSLSFQISGARDGGQADIDGGDLTIKAWDADHQLAAGLALIIADALRVTNGDQFTAGGVNYLIRQCDKESTIQTMHDPEDDPDNLNWFMSIIRYSIRWEAQAI